MTVKMNARIPRERVGAAIGKGGKIKDSIEKECNVILEINSETGEVVVKTDDETAIINLKKTIDIIHAIGRGFSYDKARMLLDDQYVLDIIDLTEYAGKSESNLTRIRGRIIGADGKARRIVEELTETYVSIYGHTVAIIGLLDDVKAAHEAVEVLAEGSMHKTVYDRLQKRRSKLKLDRLQLWERRGES